MFPPGVFEQPQTAETPEQLDPVAELQRSLNTVQLSAQDISEWWARIKSSEARVEQRQEKWDALVKRYVPTVE